MLSVYLGLERAFRNRTKIVKKLFDRLEIPEANRGFVWTKDDSIQCAIKHEWVNTSDEVEIEDLHIPGAMKRFGLEKQTCFVQQAKDLIDFKNATCDIANRMPTYFFLLTTQIMKKK